MVPFDNDVLDPIIREVEDAIIISNFQLFSDKVKLSISELERHLKFNKQEIEKVYQFDGKQPYYLDEYNELKKDQIELIQKLYQCIHYASAQNELAFVMFERFKMHRQKYIFDEDNYDVMRESEDMIKEEKDAAE